MRGVRKARPVVAAADVPAIFDEACIQRLAAIAKLPFNADLSAFAQGIREAARVYARDARGANVNELHAEIATLHRAADRRQYNRVSDLLSRLSSDARELLCDRGARPSLPNAEALRDLRQRDAACDDVARICRIGGCFVEGRRRLSGKRSRTWRWLYYAPNPQRNFPKREAERSFVMMLSLAWCEAAGKPPPRTARHADAGRKLGPFAGFVSECLCLVGANHADTVELINELNRRRKIKTGSHQPLTDTRR